MKSGVVAHTPERLNADNPTQEETTMQRERISQLEPEPIHLSYSAIGE